MEDLPVGYAKLVTGPLTINGELNDVRPAGSPDLEWYYQTAIRWIPKESVMNDKINEVHVTSSGGSLGAVKPLSMMYMWSPGRFDLSDQSTMVCMYIYVSDII